jgi:hypothetical protein
MVRRHWIEGYGALRAYIERALQITPGVRYASSATFVGIDSIVLTYACGLPDRPQKLGADLMRLNDSGQVVEWRCHY